jgi:hypothetical protein
LNPEDLLQIRANTKDKEYVMKNQIAKLRDVSAMEKWNSRVKESLSPELY